jgi:hypothetical protein
MLSWTVAGGLLTPPSRAAHQAALAQDRGDSVLADRPAGLAQVPGDPRRAILAAVRGVDLRGGGG